MKFELYRDDAGEWRWRLKAANGETIASGEGYHNRGDCIHAIELIRDGAAASDLVEADSSLK